MFHAPSATSSATILVIDDDATITRMLIHVLTEIGPYTVITASNGSLGLARCIEHMPDGVLIDMRMPYLDGEQVVRALRGDARTADLPIIMLSGFSQQEDRRRGYFAGVDFYLSKPIDIDALAATLRQALALDPQQRAQRLRALAESNSTLFP